MGKGSQTFHRTRLGFPICRDRISSDDVGTLRAMISPYSPGVPAVNSSLKLEGVVSSRGAQACVASEGGCGVCVEARRAEAVSSTAPKMKGSVGKDFIAGRHSSCGQCVVRHRGRSPYRHSLGPERMGGTSSADYKGRRSNALELIGRGHSPPSPCTALSIQQSRQTRPASPVRSSEMLGGLADWASVLGRVNM